MKVQRDAVQARNQLNFNLVKKAPQVQEDRFQPFVKGFEDKPVHTALDAALKQHKQANYQAGESRFSRNTLGAFSAAGTGAGIWAAVAGYPLVAGGIGLAAAACAGFGVRAHLQAKQADGEASLAGDAHQAMTQAADEVAASLVSDGPGPDQFTDRRYYTGGVISGIATVHSRESGALLRTQVDLGGAVPRRIEANEAKKTVAVRSPQGDQTFPGDIKLDNEGFRINAHGTQSSHDGYLSQSIEPSGNSHLYLDMGNYNSRTLSTQETVAQAGFYAHAYAWENGQVAEFSNRKELIVANPIVPFQDLTSVRLLPDGVVGLKTSSDTTYEAFDASLPTSGGIGTWSKMDQPTLASRLIETKFGNGFVARSDQKDGTIRVTAPDGSTQDSKSTLVQTNGAYRMQTQHPLGPLEQSLLPGEVLLTLQINDRTVSVQHKAGGQPMASERKDEDFLDASDALEVSLDDKGAYQVQDGVVKVEIKPLMTLEFLEKQKAS